MPFASRPETYASWSGRKSPDAWAIRYTLFMPAQPQRYTRLSGGRLLLHGKALTERSMPSAGIHTWLRPLKLATVGSAVVVDPGSSVSWGRSTAPRLSGLLSRCHVMSAAPPIPTRPVTRPPSADQSTVPTPDRIATAA